jgi:hypothetical protein
MKNHDRITAAFIAADKFFNLAIAAAKNGGFWVSAAGGTASVVAGEIARATGVDFVGACQALDSMGKEYLGEDWYSELAWMQPGYDDPEELRWDAREIAREACMVVEQ